MKKFFLLLMVMVLSLQMAYGATKVTILEDITESGQSFKRGNVVLVSDTLANTLVTTGAATTVIDDRVQNVKSVTADYTITGFDDIILADATAGAIAITLPAAADYKSIPFTIKKTDAGTNAVTFTADGGTITLDTQYDTATIFSGGTVYLIQSSNIAP